MGKQPRPSNAKKAGVAIGAVVGIVAAGAKVGHAVSKPSRPAAHHVSSRGRR